MEKNNSDVFFIHMEIYNLKSVTQTAFQIDYFNLAESHSNENNLFDS